MAGGLCRALVAVVAALALAPVAHGAGVSTESARDPSLPPSQDFSHVESTIDPSTGTWSVAYTFHGPPSADAWGNLGVTLYVGATQCADYQDAIAEFNGAATLPGDSA